MQERGKKDKLQEEPSGNGEDVAEFKVTDRRHWTRENDDETESEAEPTRPTVIDEYRERAESAERKLQEYIDAFKTFKNEQEQFRDRMQRDIERKVALRFGALVAALLESMDNLDLALSHVEGIPEAESLADGVRLARDNFRGALERSGVETIAPDGQPFDPNEAEAVRLQPVDSADADGKVIETLRPGYRLDERIIRPAQVTVGRHSG